MTDKEKIIKIQKIAKLAAAINKNRLEIIELESSINDDNIDKDINDIVDEDLDEEELRIKEIDNSRFEVDVRLSLNKIVVFVGDYCYNVTKDGILQLKDVSTIDMVVHHGKIMLAKYHDDEDDIANCIEYIGDDLAVYNGLKVKIGDRLLRKIKKEIKDAI